MGAGTDTATGTAPGTLVAVALARFRAGTRTREDEHVFRRRRSKPQTSRQAAPADPEPYATRLEAMLVADPSAPRVPILTEDEALVVVDLLERLLDQPVSERVADLARTVIVRILDRVDHPPKVSRP